MDKRHWVVYLIRCSDESLYCGITNNLNKRLAIHNSGRGAKYTRSRRPVELVGASPEMTESDALKLESQIKQVPATKKIFKLKKGENKMNLKKDLQAVNKELNTLSKKIEKMIVVVDKLVKPKAAPSKPAKKKVAVKKPASEKSAGEVTAADTVLGVIKRSKKGIDTAALMEKTGYNQKKVANIVFKLRKQGKIKNEGKGVYMKA
jgi:putative endonuclease